MPGIFKAALPNVTEVINLADRRILSVGPAANDQRRMTSDQRRFSTFAV
jgi:hypothetical protein